MPEPVETGLAVPPVAVRRTRLDVLTDQAAAAWRAAQAARDQGDLAAARRQLQRAHRIAPNDPAIALALAADGLRAGHPAEAAALLDPVAARHDVREPWLTLAAARHRLGEPVAAAAALARALSSHVLPRDAAIAPLADAIAAACGAAGWCGLDADGRIVLPASGIRPQILCDGRPLRRRAGTLTPPPAAREVAITLAGRHLLGSPLRLARMRRLEGIVAAEGGGLAGWAWHPGDPDADPPLTVTDAAGRVVLTLRADDTDMLGAAPLARPRRFQIPAAPLAGRSGPLHVRGPDGRDLPGSPLDPGGEHAAAPALPGPARARAVPPATPRPVAVVIPVYAGLAVTQDCLAAVFATIPAATRVIVIDDATPEPALATWLDRLHADRRIALLRHVRNQGFPRSANAGLRAAARLPGRPDIVLLNSDTLVTPGWLEGLRAAAHAAADIGTATPFSNDATIVSYPDNTAANLVPETRPLARLARWAARANPGVAIDIPTAVGFCMYLRRECLHDTGLFREDAFAQGYGEENDFCRRAAARGWRHVAVPGVFVAHRGGQSFGAASAALIGRNLAVMERLHPGYAALIAGFQAADPLAPARRRLDMARWRAARAHVRPGAPAGSVLLVTHDNGGGVERVVQARAAALRETGLRAILLRPAIDADGAPQHGICRLDDAAGGFPNLRFAIPAELPELARLLRPDRPARMEIHHLLGHAPEIENLAGKLGIPTDIHVHDYAMFCPRISLVGRDKRYCGEPEDPAVCEACIADLGRNTAEALPVVELRARSARQLAAARQVVVPSRDVARRWRRHFPAIAPSVAPLEDDTAWRPVARPPTRGAARHVCLIGAIGTEKGYDVLLACARDAATRGLALHFTVVGHTPDDDALMQTGRVFVTGPYREAEAEALIRAQSAHLAWLPSICPETWCFALGHAWRAGLGVAAFDIGAPAERIRSTGRGWVFPLGLPPPSINTALLAADLVVER